MQAASFFSRPVSILLGLFIVCGVLPGAFCAGIAHACSCSAPDVLGALNSSDAVFSGEVSSIEQMRVTQKFEESTVIVTFKVDQIWKGEKARKIVLYTFLNQFSCNGYHFKEGTRYLVFASAWDASSKFPDVSRALGVDLCSGTIELDRADQELKKLGPGAKPE